MIAQFTAAFFQRRIRPEQHGKFAQLRRFFQPAEIARLEVIEPAADHDLFWGIHFAAVRTFTLKAPATGLSETTIKYPPPQPEYIAPRYCF